MLPVKKSMVIVDEHHRNIDDYKRFRTPEPGMPKAFFCLRPPLYRRKTHAWLLDQGHTTTSIPKARLAMSNSTYSQQRTLLRPAMQGFTSNTNPNPMF